MSKPNEKEIAAQLAKALDLETEGAADSGGGTTPLQRSMFPWVVLQDCSDSEHPELQHFDTTTAYEVICHYGVPETVFDDFMKKEMEESESCWSLPFTLFLVVSYTGVMVYHHNCIDVHSVEHSMVDIIEEKINFAYSSPWIGHKTIYDINSITDWYSWMNKGFLPIIFPDQEVRSEQFNASLLPPSIQLALEEENANYPDPSYTRIIERYNFIVGGVMLRQERSEKEADGDCPTTSDLLKFYDRPCSRGLRYELEPDPFHARFTADPQRVVWLPAYRNSTYLHGVLHDLELSGWLDTFTQKVEIGIPIYNGEHGLHTLVTVNFFFPRTGHIWKLIIPSSVFAEQWGGGTIVYVFDFTWLYCLIHIVVTEIKEIIQEIRRTGCTKDCRDKYIGIWNTVDWVSVFAGILILTFAFIGVQIITAYNDCLQELGKMTPNEQTSAYESPNREYDEKTEDCYGSLENAVWYSNFVRIVFALYPFIIALRLLKAFAAQPRLALLTRTIWFAGQDLLHFLFVFMSIFCTAITAAMLLFGRYIDDFATVFRASTTVGRIMLGDFDWPELVYTGRLEAFLWFFLFICIVVMLLLNMIMAIIMDAYENVKEQMDNADTLFTEFKQAYGRWIGVKRGELVSMGEVLRGVTANRKEMKIMYQADAEEKEALANASGDQLRMSLAQAKVEPFLDSLGYLRVVNVEFLRNSVLKMRTEQARQLLESALMDYYNQNKAGQHFEEMTRMMYEMTAEIKGSARDLRASASAEDLSSDSEEEANLEELITTKRQEKENIALFKSELEKCEEELSHARLWIGTKLAFGDEVTTGHNPDKEDASSDESSASGVPSEHVRQQEKEIEELEEQIRVSRAEATTELEEINTVLEPKLLQASEETAEAAAKFQMLRQEYLSLVQNRKLTREDNQKALDEEVNVKLARDETFEAARMLSEANDKMKAELDELEEQRKSNTKTYGDAKTLQNLLMQIEAEQQYAHYADQMKERAHSNLHVHLNAIEGTAGNNQDVQKFIAAARERLSSQPRRALDVVHGPHQVHVNGHGVHVHGHETAI